jgi:uncharacterized membrane protein HdeD (DUF308 family)
MEITVDRSLRHWWFFLARGILFILAGIYIIASPTAGFVALGFMFGLFIFITGVAELIRVTREHTQSARSWHLFLGILDIIIGLVLMVHIGTGMVILRIILGLWFLIKAITLFNSTRHTTRSWPLIVGSILIFVFGLLILFDATFGDMTIILCTGVAFILLGIVNTIFGIRTRHVLP